MGKNSAGILSPLTGKVAGVVGFRWKDVAAIRSYVKPANPNTLPQQNQRNRFTYASKFGAAILGEVLQPLMDPFIKGQSAYNWFIQQNVQYFQNGGTPEDFTLTRGNLWSPTNVLAEFVADPSRVSISWDATLGQNGLATDDVQAVVLDAETNLLYFSASAVHRDVGVIAVTLPVGHTGAYLHSWLIASQTIDGRIQRVANSVYDDVSV